MKDKNKVNSLIRALGYFIDWYFCGVLIAVALGLLSTPGSEGFVTSILDLPEEKFMFGLIVSLTICVVYYIVIPMIICPGQTVSKVLLRYRIVMNDGKVATSKAIFIRQGIGLGLIDAYFVASTPILAEAVTYWTGSSWINSWLYILMAVTVISAVLMFIDGNSLHDRLAKTKVVKVSSHE